MTRRTKKDQGSPTEASKRDRAIKPIPLADLLPRRAVKGGAKSLFGARDEESNRAGGSTKGK